MSKNIFFREINLRGANGGIHADASKVYKQASQFSTNVSDQFFFQSVLLSRGRFMTVNGDIEGTFNATINLGLYSHDGAIRADVGLSHVDEFPRLYARTDNGFVIPFAFSIHYFYFYQQFTLCQYQSANG